MIAFAKHDDEEERHRFDELSYNFLAFSAPIFWLRLLLYLDVVRFFGTMLVVLKVMLKESVIFFALLAVVCVGFYQAFIGLDQIDDDSRITSFILQAMANSVMQAPDFDGFDNFAAPFGIILYYIFSFIVMVILLNVLIALFNSAYEDITENSIDEYMALVAEKTMQFVRAPDENVFIAPLNLIEIIGLILPFEWWLPRARYARLNHFVMGIIYAPVLLLTALIESRQARRVLAAQARGQADDAVVHEWAVPRGEPDVDYEADGWAAVVEASRPNVETDAAVLVVRGLRAEIEELKEMVARMTGSSLEKGDMSGQVESEE